MTDLGRLIRRMRFHSGNRLKDMADWCGMGTAELSGIEHGRVQATLEQLDAIAAFSVGVTRQEYEIRVREWKDINDSFQKLMNAANPSNDEPTKG